MNLHPSQQNSLGNIAKVRERKGGIQNIKLIITQVHNSSNNLQKNELILKYYGQNTTTLQRGLIIW